MIVTCQNCDTSFQLDDSRVPEQGIRVRCSRCKEAFFLEHPSASKSDAVDAVASEAVRSGGKRPPDTTQDLPSSDQVSVGGAGDEDEHDWEFNVDPSEARDSEDDSASAFGGGGFEDASGLQLEGEPQDEPGSTEIDDEADAESAFGSVDDFSSLMEEDADSTPPDLGSGPSGLETDAPSSLEVETPDLADAGHYAAQSRGDDLGEPENWDFFGDEGGDSGPAPQLDVHAGAGQGAASAGIGDLTDAWSSDSEDDYQDESAGPGSLSHVLRYAGHAAGWTVTAFLAVMGLVSGFKGTVESLSMSPQTIQVGPLLAESVRGQWVETSRGETMLVIVGDLSPRGTKPVSAGGLIEVSLLDAEGRRLEVDAQPAGLPVREVDLRESEPEVLRIVQDRAAFGLASRPIQPAAPTPFQAIFREAPLDAVRVGIRVQHEGAPPPDPVRTDVAPLGVDPMLGTANPIPAPTTLEPGEAMGAPASGSTEGTRPAPQAAPPQPSTPPSNANPLPKELTWGD